MAAPAPIGRNAGAKPHPAQFPVRWLVALLIWGASGPAWGQTDSLAIYRTIQEKAQKHKITRWIYDAIFVPPVSSEEPKAEKVPQRRVDPNIKYQGRTIRHVRVSVFDPFGFSVDDTTGKPTSGLQRWGNRLHRRTRERVVRELLLVAPHAELDPLRVAESERILRASPIVNDAAVRVVPVKGTKDSVDVMVWVHDKWNYVAYGEGGLTSASVTLRDRNLLGWGHELEQRVHYGLGTDRPELDGRYAIYNLRGSYITTTLSYASTLQFGRVGLSLDRAFYSPVAKWAGGVALSRSWSRVPTGDTIEGTPTMERLSPVSWDSWLARGFTLGDGSSAASRSSKFIVSGRYAQTRFNERPSFDVDTLRVHSNSSLALFAVGLSIRQYYKERFLYRFGATEDVPEGLLCTITTGVRKQELLAPTPYLGAEISRGGNTDGLGYVSATFGYGTFFQRGEAFDATLRSELSYFTDPCKLGRWHLREFVKLRSILGSAKPAYAQLTLGGEEMYGFDEGLLYGTHKEVLNMETVAYAPYQLLGFRFAPVFMVGLGWIGEESDPLFATPTHSAWSLGLLIRNENLLVSTFEFSVGYYPSLPDGSSKFRWNPAISFVLDARDFAFSRPDVIAF